MKLKDIANDAVANKTNEVLLKYGRTESRNEPVCDEVAELLRADEAGVVMSCPFFGDDELELIWGVLCKVRANPNRQPSAMLMQVITDANIRVRAYVSDGYRSNDFRTAAPPSDRPSGYR
jgi:hypothetical protein